MKITVSFILVLFLSLAETNAADRTTASIIAREPVTMMDLGLLKLNSMLSNTNFSGLGGATLGAIYNERQGTIDLKVNMPVKKASRSECAKIINHTKKIFVKSYGDRKVANIHHYFKHEGTTYKNKIKWDDLANHVVITGIVLTQTNYQHSVYCQSHLLKNKISY